jgi:aminoglycoside phosphotransferase (APT) family kinase protein
MTVNVEDVQILVAHHERATLRVGDVFLKVDGDQARTDVEVEAMALAPVATPTVLWRKAPVLALAALSGSALGHLGKPSTATSAAWEAAGAAMRALHDAPLPPWPGWSVEEFSSRLDTECRWLVNSKVVPVDVITRHCRVAEHALRPWTPVFTHGDLQAAHVFVDGDEVTGLIDWSDACRGDALFDLAILTLGHPEHLGDVVTGYGGDVDLDVVRAWWSLRCLIAVRWLAEHGFGPLEDMPEVRILQSPR